MKPSKATELSIHSDLSETAISAAMELLSVRFPHYACLSVSVWDVQVACELMIRMKSFYVKVTPYYSYNEWSMEYGDKCVWTHGA